MTDYKRIKAEIAAEATAATNADTRRRAEKRRQRRRPQALLAPVFGDRPYGARQCAACGRWLPAKHFWRRGKLGHSGRYVKRCKRCITRHLPTRRQRHQ